MASLKTQQLRDEAANFFRLWKSIALKGGTLMEVEWLGADKPHRCICPRGHICHPTPTEAEAGSFNCHHCS